MYTYVHVHVHVHCACVFNNTLTIRVYFFPSLCPFPPSSFPPSLPSLSLPPSLPHTPCSHSQSVQYIFSEPMERVLVSTSLAVRETPVSLSPSSLLVVWPISLEGSKLVTTSSRYMYMHVYMCNVCTCIYFGVDQYTYMYVYMCHVYRMWSLLLHVRTMYMFSIAT